MPARTISLWADANILTQTLAKSKSPVSIADGTPTETIWRILLLFTCLASEILRLSGAVALDFFRLTNRYTQAIALDSSVAKAAPTTSCPFGSRTNINSGSRPMFNSPPRLKPMLAWLEYPAFLSRYAAVRDSMLNTQPNTTTSIVY